MVRSVVSHIFFFDDRSDSDNTHLLPVVMFKEIREYKRINCV